MKHTISFFITLIYGACLNLHSQVVGQDAEGFSTIVLPSSNLYLEVADPKASFSFYKEVDRGKVPYPDLIDEQKAFNGRNLHIKSDLTTTDLDEIREFLKTKVWKQNSDKFKNSDRADYAILGGEISGGISNGLSTLFSGGEFSTANRITGLIGYNYTRLKYKNEEDLINEYIKAKHASDRAILQLADNAKIIISELDRLVRLGAINSGQKDYYSGFSSGNYSSDMKGVKQFKKEIEALRDKNQINLASLISKLKDVKGFAAESKKFASQIVSRDQLDKAKEEKDKALSSLKNKAKNNLINKRNIEGKTKEITDKLKSVSTVGKTTLSEINTTINNDYYNVEKWEEVIKLLNKKLDDLEYFTHNQNKANFDNLIQAYNKRIDELKKAEKQMTKQVKKINKINYFTRTIIYARGGYNGASFKLDRMNNAMTIDTRFRDVKFDGYTMNFGITRQWRVYNYLGFSVGMAHTYNASALKSRTFKLTTEDTSINDGSFSSTEEITALTGTLDKFLRYNLSLDYVHLFTLKESLSPDNNTGNSHLYLSLNPYIRHFGYENAETIKNNTVLGVGIHAFNSKDNKLMGGVFVQTNDTFGANKSTPNALGNRFTFGLIAKFGFTGLKPETK